VYTKPLPNVTPGTTIESTVYNTFVADVETDLNAARPIIAGGTGATNATQARDNLDAERSGAQVTNYDTHVFEAGSFWSAIGATAAPNSINRFIGTCILTGDGSNDIYIQVMPPGASTPTYTRRKNAGVWGLWALMPGAITDLDAVYVNVTGDTMTGPLTVNGATAISGTLTAGATVISGTLATTNTATINNGSVLVKSAAQYSVSAWNTTGGGAYGLWSATATPQMEIGQVDGNGVPVTGYIFANATQFYVHTGSAYKPGGGAWLVSASDARVKNVLGNYENGLDAIKTLQPVRYSYKGNDTLQPPQNVKEVDESNVLIVSETKEAVAVPYGNSPNYVPASTGQEFIGLIAQACEAAFPEMVIQRAGMIDGQPVTDLRSMDTGPLIFALVNSCKELAARVEALEAQINAAR